MADPKLASSHFQKPNLPSVAIQQDQSLEATPCQLGSHGLHQVDQLLRPQAEGAGKPLMFGGKADLLHGKSPNRQLCWQGLNHRFHQPIGEEGIGAQWQMGAMLLQRTHGPDHRAAWLAGRKLNLRPGKAFQTLLQPA